MDQDNQSLIPADWDVPEAFRQRLGEQVGRQRAMFHEGHLLLVLHAPPDPEESSRSGHLYWRNPQGEWRSNSQDSGSDSVASMLHAYGQAIGKLDEQEAAAQTSQEYFAVLHALTPLVRSTHNLHGALQEARQLAREDRAIINLRDQAYALERQAELLQSDAKNALDFRIARQAEEQARASDQMAIAAHRLNILAAFFFPIATLTAIFGVNLWHPWAEVKSPIPILILLGSGVLLGAALTLLIVRRGRRP